MAAERRRQAHGAGREAQDRRLLLLEVDDEGSTRPDARRAGCRAGVAGDRDGRTEAARRRRAGAAPARGGPERGPARSRGPAPPALRPRAGAARSDERELDRRSVLRSAQSASAGRASSPGGPSTSRPWCAGTRFARATVTSAAPSSRVDADGVRPGERVVGRASGPGTAPARSEQRVGERLHRRQAHDLRAPGSGAASRKRGSPPASVGQSCCRVRPAPVARLVVGVDDLEDEQVAGGQPAVAERVGRASGARARTRSHPAGRQHAVLAPVVDRDLAERAHRR